MSLNTYDPYSEKVISKVSNNTKYVWATLANIIEIWALRWYYWFNAQYRIIRHIIGNELDVWVNPTDSFIVDQNGIRAYDLLGNEKFNLSKSGVLNVHDNILFQNWLNLGNINLNAQWFNFDKSITINNWANTGNIQTNAFWISFDKDIEVIGKNINEVIIAWKDSLWVWQWELIMRWGSLIFRKPNLVETILVI